MLHNFRLRLFGGTSTNFENKIYSLLLVDIYI